MAIGMLKQAQSTHSEGRLAEAATYYREFLDSCPDTVEAIEGLGIVLFQLGRIEEAAALFARGLAIHAESASLHAKLGAACRNLGRFDEARDHLPEGHRPGSNPARPLELARPSGLRSRAVRRRFGNVVRLRGRLDEAVACYQRALIGDPRRASSHHLIGHVLQCCGRFDEAARFYEAARTLQPKDPRFHADFGNLTAVRGDYDESARHYLSAVTLDPNFVEGHQGRVVTYAS